MAWNSLESFVDTALLAVVGMPARVGLDVIARIGGFDAKDALIRRIGEVRLGISEERCPDVFNAVKDALANAKELKGYRDDVIHCQLVNASEALGLLVKRDAQFEVQLSQEALDGLYNRLISVRDELRTVCLILLTLDEALKADAQADLQTLLRGPEVQAYVS
jgi:hypothetical protein